MADPQSKPPPVRPGDPIELETSVAGEEDPGASLDVAAQAQDAPKVPGDAAQPAVPGAGKKP